jgi:hypothetical protein
LPSSAIPAMAKFTDVITAPGARHRNYSLYPARRAASVALKWDSPT